MEIIKTVAAHWEDIRRIYEEGILTGNATFESKAPDWQTWDTSHSAELRFVAIEDDQIIGWSAITPVSGRCVYAGVGEVSIYVDQRFQGKGVGKFLLRHLIEASERKGLWTLQAGIFPENVASLEIHHQLGFREIGRREKIGKMNGIWRDTILLEKRSSNVGTE